MGLKADKIHGQWYLPSQVQKPDSLHYLGFTGAIASFFMTGDPNKLKLTNASASGVPEFSSGRQFVVGANELGQVGYELLEERCGFWKSMRSKIPI